MGRNHLAHASGDAINAVLAAACQCRFKFPQMCRSKIPQPSGLR
jgi:hypothetical protein